MDEPLPAMTGVVLELVDSMQQLAGDAAPPEMSNDVRLVATFLEDEFDAHDLVLQEVARALDI